MSGFQRMESVFGDLPLDPYEKAKKIRSFLESKSLAPPFSTPCFPLNSLIDPTKDWSKDTNTNPPGEIELKKVVANTNFENFQHQFLDSRTTTDGDNHDRDNKNENQVEDIEETQGDILLDLMIWASLLDRPQQATIFWKRTSVLNYLFIYFIFSIPLFILFIENYSLPISCTYSCVLQQQY